VYRGHHSKYICVLIKQISNKLNIILMHLCYSVNIINVIKIHGTQWAQNYFEYFGAFMCWNEATSNTKLEWTAYHLMHLIFQCYSYHKSLMTRWLYKQIEDIIHNNFDYFGDSFVLKWWYKIIQNSNKLNIILIYF
jgi:hypothetical protein